MDINDWKKWPKDQDGCLINVHETSMQRLIEAYELQSAEVSAGKEIRASLIRRISLLESELDSVSTLQSKDDG